MAVGVGTLGSLLRSEIDRRGISQTQAATELEVPQSVLSRWISGQMQPSTEKCRSIGRFLRLPAEEVLRVVGHLATDDDSPRGRRALKRQPGWSLIESELYDVFQQAGPKRWRPLVTSIRTMVTAFSQPLTDGYLGFFGSSRPVGA